MTRHDLKYRPAPGCNRFTLLFPNALYVGEDHLLLRTRVVLAEYYRRVYFADIQALVLEPTTARWIWAVIFGLLGLTGMFVGVFGEPWAICSGVVFLAAMIANIAMGPTCRCHIQTAVRCQTLPSVTRLGRAREFLASIQPAIAASQGEASAQQVRADSIRNLVSASLPAAIDAQPSDSSNRYAGGVHAVLFALMIGEAALIVACAFVYMWDILIVLSQLLNMIFVVVARGKQARTVMPKGLKKMPTYIALYPVAMIVAILFMSYVLDVGATGNRTSFLPHYAFYYFVMAACSAAMGIIGFLQLSAFRRVRKAQKSAVPPLREITEDRGQ